LFLEVVLRTSSPFEEQIITMIEPVVQAAGYEIVRLRIMGGRSKTLQIMAERPDGLMNAGDCQKLARALGPVLEENDPIDGDWELEVSSPGIDRPLTRLADFDRWEGFRARLELNRMVENRKRFVGDLAGTEDANVLIDLEGEEDTAVIPFDWLSMAKLVLTDELIAEDLARKGPLLGELDLTEGLDDDDDGDAEGIVLDGAELADDATAPQAKPKLKTAAPAKGRKPTKSTKKSPSKPAKKSA
jgi:ribosome maturation factor RimP